jgi:hypothetical protein
VARDQIEMTAMRAIYCATLVASVGFSTGIAVNHAASQELSMRNELIPQPNPSQPGTVAPAAGAIQTSNLLPAAKSQVVNLWQSAAMGRPNPLWAIPIPSLNDTRERPIFSASRRAPPPVAPPAPQVQQVVRSNEPNRPILTLMATVAEDGEGIAVFRDEASKNILRLRTGESHSGWTLSTVKPREVTMLRDHDTAILDIPSP